MEFFTIIFNKDSTQLFQELFYKKFLKFDRFGKLDHYGALYYKYCLTYKKCVLLFTFCSFLNDN